MDICIPRGPYPLFMAGTREPNRYDGPDRRRRQADDFPGPDRRGRNGRERFLLIRDSVLVGVGAVGILAVTIAALFVGIKDSAVALAVLATCGGLLGLPTWARLDELRRDGK
jgi:hypothetical protein